MAKIPIVNAAGNIKCIFDDGNDCCKAVLRFPKTIREMVPTVTISQAVVRYDDDDFEKAGDELEKRLHTQRNRPAKSLVCGFMSVERSRTTGLPAVEINGDGEFLDEATRVKRRGRDFLKDRTGERTLELCRKPTRTMTA